MECSKSLLKLFPWRRNKNNFFETPPHYKLPSFRGMKGQGFRMPWMMDGSCGVDEVRCEKLFTHFSFLSVLRPNEDERERRLNSLSLCFIPSEAGLCCLSDAWDKSISSAVSQLLQASPQSVSLWKHVRETVADKQRHRDRNVARVKNKNIHNVAS